MEGVESGFLVGLCSCFCWSVAFSGDDNPYHMALEDLAMFRAIPNCTVFYPSDAISTEHAVYLAANTKVCLKDAKSENGSGLYYKF